LVDELKDTGSQATLPATVCFFFCDDKIESQKSANAVLCGLLHQLFYANRSLIRHAMHHFEVKGSQIAKDTKTLWDIFRAASNDTESGDIICVIDALDECEEFLRRLLIKWFIDCIVKSPSPHRPFLKVTITSRGYQSLEKAFHFVSHVRLKAEEMTESISADVL
jgi:ankyrin repeat domain-containing protein 50